MDALQAAQRIYDSTFANLADKVLEVDVDQALQIAIFCTGLAQAEQLKRIADALEIMAHPNRIVAPDPQDYYSEDEYNDAAAKYDYHKNSHPGESLMEYQARWEADNAHL